jgi:preprotein translocase subunit SecG
VLLTYLMTAFYVLVCFILLMVVLLQQGRGGDIASAFGGSSSQAAFGARAGATVLTRVTTVCAVLFMFGALALAVLWQHGTTASVVSGKSAPASQSAPAKPAPPPAKPPSQQPNK